MNVSGCDWKNGSGGCGCEISSRLNECMWQIPHSEPVAGIIAFAYVVIFVLAFSWNILVIGIFLKDRKLLQQPSSVFLLGLAVVDFLEALLSIPFYTAALIGGGWIFGDTDETRQGVCTAVGLFLSVFLFLTVHLLALVSFDRFLYIVFAVKYEQWMKPWRALLLASIVSIVPLILASTPLYGFGELRYSDTLGVCTFGWIGQRVYVVVVGIEALLPITAIIVFTLWTWIYVKRFLKRRHKRQKQFTITQQDLFELNVKKQQLERTLTRVFSLLLVSQLVCFTPGILIVFAGFFVGYENIPPAIPLIGFVTIISNAAINPIIQSLTRRSIRRYPYYFIYILTCGHFCAGVTQEESSDSQAPMQSQCQMTRLTSIELLSQDGDTSRVPAQSQMTVEIIAKEEGDTSTVPTERRLSNAYAIDPVEGTLV